MPDPRLDVAWRDDRRYLLSLAKRTLGDSAAAEDVVQEAFGALVKMPPGEVDDVRGWLTVVVRRLSLNRLRSAYSRRESVADTLPEDGGTDDPADRVTLDDQVRQALAVVLDRLSPAERTSFVLHDVFGFPFGAVAEIVGRTPAACRQLASRARRSVRAGDDVGTDTDDTDGTSTDGERHLVTPAAARHSLLAERFVAAASGGDLAALVEVLDPDVAGDAVLVGHGPFVHAEGFDQVAGRLLRLFGPATGMDLVPFPVEDQAGVVAVIQGRVHAVILLTGTDTVRLIQAYVLPAAHQP